MKWFMLDEMLRYATRLIVGDSGQNIGEFLAKIDANMAKIQSPSDEQMESMSRDGVDIAAFFKEQEDLISYYVKTKKDTLMQCRTPFQRDLLTNGRILGFGFNDPKINKRMLIPPQFWAFLEIDFARSTAAGNGYFFGGLQFLDPKEVSDDDRTWLREQLVAMNLPAKAEQAPALVQLSGEIGLASPNPVSAPQPVTPLATTFPPIDTPTEPEKSARELKESSKQATHLRNKQWKSRETALLKDNPGMAKNEAARIIAREHNEKDGKNVTWVSVARILRS